MKRLIIMAALLIGLSIAFLSCRSRMPCPTYTVYEPEAEETVTDDTDN